jgi:asparagine synthase (glutamine-hydrolysing)
MLSGGLDSTSITCLARDQLRAAGAEPLPVFSWIFSDCMPADEREFQQHALAAGGLRPFVLDSAVDEASPWTDIGAFLPDGPLYATNYYLNLEAGRKARGAGVRIILDGLGGDSTISRGGPLFVELFLAGRWFALVHQLRALAAISGTPLSLGRLFLTNVAARLAPLSLMALYQRARRHGKGDEHGLRLLTPRARLLSGAARHQAPRFFTTRGEHLAQFEAPLLAEGLEMVDRVWARAGVEGRYPFFDRRLAEYCLSLPADQKQDEGYSRMVARRALEGVLPREIQWRAGKGRPGLHIISALRAGRPLMDDLFLRDPSMLEPYVDIDVLRRVYADLFTAESMDFRTAIQLWSIAVLGQWLRSLDLAASELRLVRGQKHD